MNWLTSGCMDFPALVLGIGDLTTFPVPILLPGNEGGVIQGLKNNGFEDVSCVQKTEP